MFSLTPELPSAENTTNEHPWARRIKDKYSNKFKHAHNSIRNPQYPKEKEKNPRDLTRTKFTVIGDRVTKEFIYCSNLVKGLYKYRKKIFEAPVIQGVTTVEWPVIWKDLKDRHGGMAYCLTSSVAVLVNNKFLGGEAELKELISTKFSYHLLLDYYKESIAEFAKFIRGSGRPCVYMKISIDGKETGNLLFLLYSDILPFTSANFLRLCKDTKGGYSGTPIHRIVKDGWIQGGGFGLKETDLDCENFIIPHDRRGVLGMANSGLHMECSMQFFVLLQPAPWMAHKFVAFGQLIEGKETLEKIEAVPTWYESPASNIVIYKAGIFNMDCHDIMINKNTNEYIDRHIEDLNELGELFYEELIERVFLTAQLKELEKLKQEHEGEGGDDETAAGLRETKRFNRKKEDIERQLQTTKDQPSRPSTAVSRATGSVVQPTSGDANVNNDFDVETYDPEFEGTDYHHQSIHTPSLIVKPKKPFYIPLTDVLYPGEKDSNFDLKRFLQGDYCLESDLIEPAKTFIPQELQWYASDLFDSDESDLDVVESIEDRELKRHLKSNIDHVSFAGNVVRGISKTREKFNLFDDVRKSELISDNLLRKMRLATIEHHNREPSDKKVSISAPPDKPSHIHIRRRQTGFIRPEDLKKMHLGIDEVHNHDDDDDDDDDINVDKERKVRITVAEEPTRNLFGGLPKKIMRRQTGVVREVTHDEEDDDDDDHPGNISKVRIVAEEAARHGCGVIADDDDDERGLSNWSKRFDEDEEGPDIRQSVLVRLFEEVKCSEEPPTLKDYKPMLDNFPKNPLLTFSSNFRIKNESLTQKEQQRYLRHSVTVDDDSFENVLNMQHGKRMTRKISSDYVKTIDQIEHKLDNSIRTVEFAKRRPTLSVSEYQMKTRKYNEEKKGSPLTYRGLRLPGDTPLHSSDDVPGEEKKEKEKAYKIQPKGHHHQERRSLKPA